MQTSKHLMNQKIQQKVFSVFIKSIKNNQSADELIEFLNDLLSPAEKGMLSKRVAIAFMLLEAKYTYEDICKTLKVSKGTIAKIHAIISVQGKGFKKTLGDIIFKKKVSNTLKEFLDFLRPKHRNLSGDVFKKTSIDLQKEINKPL